MEVERQSSISSFFCSLSPACWPAVPSCWKINSLYVGQLGLHLQSVLVQGLSHAFAGAFRTSSLFSSNWHILTVFSTFFADSQKREAGSLSRAGTREGSRERDNTQKKLTAHSTRLKWEVLGGLWIQTHLRTEREREHPALESPGRGVQTQVNPLRVLWFWVKVCLHPTLPRTSHADFSNTIFLSPKHNPPLLSWTRPLKESSSEVQTTCPGCRKALHGGRI